MMPILLPIQEHETVRSYVRRMLVVNAQGLDANAITRFLYGEARSHGVHPTMPHCLSRVVTCLEQACGSPEAVLHRHTLFDYYYAFASAAVRGSRESRLLQSCRGPRMPTRFCMCYPMPPGITAICPVCEQQSLVDAGFAVERRIHLMPYQCFCPVHGVLLRYAPACPTVLSSGRLDRMDSSRIALQQTYEARSLEHVLNVQEDSCERLGCTLMERGYVTSGGHIRRSELMHGIQAFFSQGFVDARLTEVVRGGKLVDTFLDAWRRGDRVPSPLAGTLLSWFLTDAEARAGHNASHPVAARVADDMPALPNFDEYPSIRSAACAVGLKYVTALNQAVRAGYTVSLRPKTFRADTQALAIGLLQHGLPREVVARKCGVSLVTIHRFCARTMVVAEQKKRMQEERGRAARERWLGAHAANPELSRTDIRRRIGADWTWLRRHDREWLCKAEAGCPRVLRSWSPSGQPNGSTPALAVAIERAKAWELRSSSKPTRVSLGYLSRFSGIPAHFVSMMIPDGFVESDAEWVTRRLKWAASSDPTIDCDDLAHWKLWRVACIRPRRGAQ
ncbi:TnsD family Tn7-like transposition protein [Ralstonia pseudosolanacearum]